MAKGDEQQRRDFEAGIPLSDIPASGLLAGQVRGKDVLLARGQSGLFAIGGQCTHLGAPLAEGLVVGDTVRCPWHHACFDLKSGAAIAAPAFEDQPCWAVEERNGTVMVKERATATASPAKAATGERVVIIGAGAGGYAAADALLKLGYAGSITVVGHDADPPYDRTLLTKDYLDGRFGEDRLPIEGATLQSRGVDLRTAATVVAIDRPTRMVRLAGGEALPYDHCVLATGAEPKRLTVPGSELSHVLVLRSAEDARAILAQASAATRITVVGSSFVGMEAAASLRSRGFPVTVVTPEKQPFAKILGPEIAAAILAKHKKEGVLFHFGREVARIEPDHIELDDGSVLGSDLVVVGVGVSPRMALAEHAGLTIDNGVVVDEQLRTSDAAIFAVGDIACWPDPHSGQRIRVEHWDVAVRQGQVAAMNIMGLARRYDVVPFFWTKHFDFSVRYVGHATDWEAAPLEGDLASQDAEVRLIQAGRTMALATVGRDVRALEFSSELEQRAGGSPAVSLPG